MSKIDPAEYISKHWPANFVTFNGIDFGFCMQYDVLQIINRSILREDVKRAELEAGAAVGGTIPNVPDTPAP